ncbi:hypothetical protein R1sor_024241 [Riccia sorocarpa]|uniref:GDSL esterase/lipase n=1 Tax=Riccia sorocarpa TaxID=122646 RepID=A0ABD3GPY5_9MARC
MSTLVRDEAETCTRRVRLTPYKMMDKVMIIELHNYIFTVHLAAISVQLVLLGLIPATTANPEPRLLFVFGDSYADGGNLPPGSVSAWHAPYGMFRPGKPVGRFSDGFVATNILAEALQMPSPTPFRVVLQNASISGGVNFAVGGSGVTHAFGAPPFQIQVVWFASMVLAGLFTPEDLNRALVFVSVVGNDYAAYNGSSLEGYFPLTHEVPLLIDLNLRTLYSLGARNFIVSSISALDCLPTATASSGFMECEKNATVDAVIAAHNHHLGNRLENITRNLENSSVLYLQQTRSMHYVLNHLPEFNLTEGLKPCCVGVCGSVDVTGNPLYTVCENPERHFFWDGIHPTEAGWRAVVELYKRPRFTRFARSLSAWVDSLRP